MRGHKAITVLVFLVTVAFPLLSKEAEAGWWPEFRMPSDIIVCPVGGSSAEKNLVQSVAGLVNRAVNEGVSDTGVWIDNPNPAYGRYFDDLKQSVKGKVRRMSVYELLKWAVSRGIVKSYVLYDFDNPQSVNVATVHCSLDGAVMAERSIARRVESGCGLECSFDASSCFSAEDFTTVRDRLNNSVLCLLDPRIPNNRDFAIATRSMVYYGVDRDLDTILEWCRPLSPVIGWNSGPESGHIEPCARYGLLNTVSDFCSNLPLLCAIPAGEPRFKGIDPSSIDFSDTTACHALLMSDGDNLQWTANAMSVSEDYWMSPYAPSLSMNFTTCGVNMCMGPREVMKCMTGDQRTDVFAVEFGGGYYYPDLFAMNRGEDRASIIKDLSRMVGGAMKRSGLSVAAFICKDIRCTGSMEFFETFARENPWITGILALQYYPYNAGHGQTFWVDAGKGLMIPVSTPTGQVWANLDIEGSGTPEDVFGYVRTSGTACGWTIVHAWSRFSLDTDGRTIVPVDRKEHTGARGVEPLEWGRPFLGEGTRLCSIEEMLWRIRMREYPEKTKQIITTHK